MSAVDSARNTAAGLAGTALLTHLGVIRAQGEDAVKFLQGQLTQDVALMPVGDTRLAAFCNAKGRMQASFWVHKCTADELLLVTSADILPATLKRLTMFVMRSRLKLSDATADFSLYGLLGDAAVSGAASGGQTRAEGQNDAENLLLPLPPAAGTPRTLCLAPAGAPVPADPALAEADWLWAEVRRGVARITQPVVHKGLRAQMLNYESVGGVNFQGAALARKWWRAAEFRGAIKRRAFVGQVDGAAQADEVFDAADPSQPVGLIAQAAAAPGGGTALIASLKLEAAEAELRVGAAEARAWPGWPSLPAGRRHLSGRLPRRRSAQHPRHPDVRDAHFLVRLAIRRVAQAAVETFGAALGAQHHAGVTAQSRRLLQRLHHLAAYAGAAQRAVDRHAADARGAAARRAFDQQAAGGHRHAEPVGDQGVHGGVVGFVRYSSSRAMPCSCTNTASRTARAPSPSVAQSPVRTSVTGSPARTPPSARAAPAPRREVLATGSANT